MEGLNFKDILFIIQIIAFVFYTICVVKYGITVIDYSKSVDEYLVKSNRKTKSKMLLILNMPARFIAKIIKRRLKNDRTNWKR